MISITLGARDGQAEVTMTIDFDEPIPPHEQPAAIRRAWAAFRRGQRDDEGRRDGRAAMNADTN